MVGNKTIGRFAHTYNLAGGDKYILFCIDFIFWVDDTTVFYVDFQFDPPAKMAITAILIAMP